jgi:hypothetical protein
MPGLAPNGQDAFFSSLGAGRPVGRQRLVLVTSALTPRIC